jgi:CBS-domain-containing membrane protein
MTKDIKDATKIMEMHQIRRLPVLNCQQCLVGIISLADIGTHFRADHSARQAV